MRPILCPKTSSASGPVVPSFVPRSASAGAASAHASTAGGLARARQLQQSRQNQQQQQQQQQQKDDSFHAHAHAHALQGRGRRGAQSRQIQLDLDGSNGNNNNNCNYSNNMNDNDNDELQYQYQQYGYESSSSPLFCTMAPEKRRKMAKLLQAFLKARGIHVHQVRQLLQEHPELARESYGGCLPLHWACRRRTVDVDGQDNVNAAHAHEQHQHQHQANLASLELIQLLVDLFPESLLVPDKTGLLPLHLACLYSKPVELIQFLLSRCTASVSAVNREGKTALHLADNEHAVQYLLSLTGPAGVCVKDEQGRTPVHCLKGKTYNAIKCLVDTFPAVIAWPDHAGNTPLHLALASAMSHGHVNVRLIELFVAACPSAVRIRDQAGRIPLHLAVLCINVLPEHVALQLIRILTRHFPTAVQQTDFTGTTPLHLALDPRYCNYALVELLVRTCPTAVHSVKDQHGHTCLHVACHSNASLQIVHLLVSVHPAELLFFAADVTKQEVLWPGREIKWHLSRYGW